MVTITYNGKKMEIQERQPLSELLKEIGVCSQGIAIARNQVVVAKDEWSASFLVEGDCIDVVRAIQGG